MNYTNTFNAAAPEILSMVLAAGVCFFIYSITINKWFGDSRKSSRRSSLKWWCGVIALLSIVNSLAGFFGEFLYLIFNNSELRIDYIVRYLTLTVLNPVIILIIAYVLLLFVKDELKQNIKYESNNLENNSSYVAVKNRNDVVKIVSISVVVFVVGFVLSGNGSSIFSSNEFKINSCQLCDEDSKCKSSEIIKGFKVFENSIQMYIIDNKKMDRIKTLPENDKMKCAIAKHRNNAFECSSFQNDGYSMEIKEIVFDGKEKLIDKSSFLNSSDRKIIFQSDFTCKVN